jgi:hypothetical protein
MDLGYTISTMAGGWCRFERQLTPARLVPNTKYEWFLIYSTVTRRQSL